MMIALRLLHVLAGIFWVGSVFLVAAFILPSVRAAGPAGGQLMGQLMEVRRLPFWITTANLTTIASGLVLYWKDSAGLSAAWIHSGTGMTFTIGALIAILSAILGILLNKPTAHRLAAVGAQIRAAGGHAPELAAEASRLQARLAAYAWLAAGLVLVSAAAMAVARYIP